MYGDDAVKIHEGEVFIHFLDDGEVEATLVLRSSLFF